MTRVQFEALADDDLEALRPFGVRRRYPPGATLFRQGDRPTQVHVIVKGVVELVHETLWHRVVVQIVHAGSSIDEVAIVLDAPHSYTAIAVSRATVLEVRADTVRALSELFPEISARWLRLMASSLGHAHERILELSGRSALEQVAHFLLNESSKGRGPIVELTQDEVAASLGLSRQTVSRVLRDLAQARSVRRGRGRIVVLDAEILSSHLTR
jgi:CRP-like cAMP-binding protein